MLLATDRAWRLPSCTSRCELVRTAEPDRYGRWERPAHDAYAHEAWGRDHDDRRLLVRTGALGVDLLGNVAYLAGRTLSMSALQWRLLAYFARNCGRLCTRDDLLLAGWNSAYTGEYHLLRVNLSRLRSVLGAWGSLIETTPAQGYRLRRVDPTDTPEAPPRWAHSYEHCIVCRRTDTPHGGRGVCERCRWRVRAAAHEWKEPR